MASVVTVMNMKGGVGKSTVTMHMAGIFGRYVLGAKPMRVLMIDYDPQFNLSQAFLPASTYFALEAQRKTTISILLDDPATLNPYELQVPGNASPPSVKGLAVHIYSTKSGTLDLVPSTLDMMYIALGQSEKSTKPMEERFEKFIKECSQLYDVIFIDCHPAGSIFTKTALQNSDHVLIPVIPQKFAVRGIGLMTQFIKAKKHGASAPIPCVLFNSTARTGTSNEEAAIRANKDFGPLCLGNTLKKYRVFSEPEAGKGFVWFSQKPWSTEAFHNLKAVCAEYATRIGV